MTEGQSKGLVILFGGVLALALYIEWDLTNKLNTVCVSYLDVSTTQTFKRSKDTREAKDICYNQMNKLLLPIQYTDLNY